MTASNIFNLSELSRRSKLVLLALVAGVLLPAVSLVSTAHAEYACTVTQVCIYDGDSGFGTRYAFNGSPGLCLNVPGYANDMANSYYNRFTTTQGYPRHVSFYQDANCTGNILQLNDTPVPYSGAATFPYKTTRPAPYDNRNLLTSIRFHTF